MKNSLKKGIFKSMVCVLVLMTLCFSNGIINVAADDPHYTLEGTVIDENTENPIEGLLLMFTNLDTEEYFSTETDEYGYYSVDFTDEEWEVPFEYRVDTSNAEELDYLPTGFAGEIIEDINSYFGDMELVDELLGTYSTQTIYCGDYTLHEYSSYQQGVSVDSNVALVNTWVQDNLIIPYFETHLRDHRTNSQYIYYENFIETDQLYPVQTKYTTYQTGYYTAPENLDHTPFHNFYLSGSYGNTYPMESFGGYYLDFYREDLEQWVTDGNGCGVHTYWAHLVAS